MPESHLVLRHRFSDRLLHWLFAVSILILLATGLLPVFGINFDWVLWHWVTGVVFILFLLWHAVRSLFLKSPRPMWFEGQDLKAAKPGKYSLAQKLMHNVVALLALAGVITGVLMMVRIDTPLWERNPYLLDASTWGFIYVLHGLVALCFLSVIMLHVYFSLRPEKKMYLRSIFKGWLSREEYRQLHDSQRWQPVGQQQDPHEK